jgi:polyhydroxyalkanoate synthesis repressor PhaR
MSKPASDDPVVIKKYANRRLYNTASSQYVTLEDLAALVHSGTDFIVHDAKTGEDLTRSVLTQIIFEQESKGENLLPVQFLRQLISFYGGQMQGILPSYLEASLKSFAEGQEKLVGTMGGTDMFRAFEAQAKRNMELFSTALGGFSLTPAKPASSTPSPDVDALKAQLDALKQQIDNLGQR